MTLKDENVKNGTLLIEPHYAGNLEYFVLYTHFDAILLEVNDHFIKQTFRNRCAILTANGILNLTVPVIYSNRTRFKDVKIDYHQTWVKDHKRAIQSAYSKAPFYAYYVDELYSILESKHRYLFDLDLDLLTFCLKCLQVDISVAETHDFFKIPENGAYDFRNVISAKKSYETRNIYKPFGYLQNFGKKFVPNLSVLDTIMCTGPQASEIVRASSNFFSEEQI